MYQSDNHSLISLQSIVNTVQTVQIMNNQLVTSKLLAITGKSDKALNMETLLMKFSKTIYIHNLGAYINMLKTKDKSIETIYFPRFYQWGPQLYTFQ